MPCLKPPKREGKCAPSVRKGRCWVALHWAGTARTTSPLDGDARICTTEPEETKHPVLQRRYLFSERSSVRGWQDLRAVHDSRGPGSERRPFLAGSSRGVFPNGCLRGFSDAWRAYLAKASPFSDAWRANLAANWRFSRPRPLSGCMERKICHGLPPGNAPWRNLATDRRSGTHRARILPLPVRPRAHQGAILPPSDAGKRISRAFCHRRAPENAPREYIATASRPRTHSRRSCHGRTLGFAPHQITAALPA